MNSSRARKYLRSLWAQWTHPSLIFPRTTLITTQNWLRLTLLQTRTRRAISQCLLTILTLILTLLKQRTQKKNTTQTLATPEATQRVRVAGMMHQDLKKKPRKQLKLKRKLRKQKERRLQLREKRKRVRRPVEEHQLI